MDHLKLDKLLKAVRDALYLLDYWGGALWVHAQSQWNPDEPDDTFAWEDD